MQNRRTEARSGRKFFQTTIFLVLGLELCGFIGAYCQDSSTLTALEVRDNAGHSVVIQYGLNPSATYCIDPALGEFELPPGGCIGPSMCVSLKDTRTGDGACLGEGLLLDVRPYYSPSQVDTYRVAIAILSYPVVLRWPADVATQYDSMKIVDGVGGFLVSADMLAIDSLVLDSALVPELFIIASNPHVISAAEVQKAPDDLSFTLLWNYPNPFNPSTQIEYVLPVSANISLSVFDVMGREIKSLLTENQTAGRHTATWHAEGIPAGTYFAVLRAGNLITTRLLLLLK